ncbi:hypothetical protein LDENG_00108160 [Lucifuga dentata]|nr:hypothetical protein LDENG_00108160 [Lucifuga dentata]
MFLRQGKATLLAHSTYWANQSALQSNKNLVKLKDLHLKGAKIQRRDTKEKILKTK